MFQWHALSRVNMYHTCLIFLGLVLISVSVASVAFNYEEERQTVLDEIKHVQAGKVIDTLIDKIVDARKLIKEQGEKVDGESNKLGVVIKPKTEDEIKKLKKMGVIEFYRVCIDHMKWLVQVDKEIQNEMKKIDRTKIIIPTEISPDGQELYKSCYCVWLGLAKVMQNTTDEYWLVVKKEFEKVGFDISQVEHLASIAATLLDKTTDDSQKDDVELKNDAEDETLQVLRQDLDVNDEDQIKFARVIYRLNL